MLPVFQYWNVLEMLSLCYSAMVFQFNFVFIEIVLTEAHGIQGRMGWKKMS